METNKINPVQSTTGHPSTVGWVTRHGAGDRHWKSLLEGQEQQLYPRAVPALLTAQANRSTAAEQNSSALSNQHLQLRGSYFRLGLV